MHEQEFIEKYLIEAKNSGRETLSEIKLSQTQPDGITLSKRVISDSDVGFLLGWVLLGMTLSAILMVIRSEFISFEPVDPIPCKKCRFFSSNPYIKCAVHPCIALTEKAINCSDYLPEEGKILQKSPAKPD